MKLTCHHFSHQFLILMVAILQATTGNRVQAQPQLSEDGNTQKQPETSSQSAKELPFRVSDGYLILVEGAIGTRTHLKFLLDTGASMSVVDSKIADGLKLHREPTQSFNFDSEFARNVDAIIGLDLLQLKDFTVDYTSKKIIFHSSANRLAPARDDALTNGLTLQIRIQGHPFRLIVDTGFPSVLLFEERLSARVPELEMTRSISNVILGERLHAKATDLRDVAIGPNKRDVSVLLAQAPPPEILPGIDGVLGISALKARRVHFNFTERILSWE
jgi:predicted aspartyl protease